MTELAKLKNAESLIRDMTVGRLQVATSIGNHIYIRPKDDAYIGMDMMIRGNYLNKCYDVTFDAHVRRMGTPMTAADLGRLAQEVQQAQSLLTALEMTKLHPTQKDLERFHAYLLENQQNVHAHPQQEQASTDSLTMQNL